MNTRGGAGKNVPVDLHNEHLNGKLKDVVSWVGANVTEELIVEASKSLNGVDTICEHYDTATGQGWPRYCRSWDNISTLEQCWGHFKFST